MVALRARGVCLLVLAGAAIATATGPLLAEQKVTNSDPHFNLRLPPGFVPDEQLSAAAPNILHSFYLANPAEEYPEILLFIERLQGELGRERLSPDDVPPGSEVRLFLIQWHNFEVEAFEVPELIEGEKFLTYNVQIPLEKNAIQIKLFGPAERRPELEQLLPEILGGLYGKSNWHSSQFGASPFANSPQYRYVIIGMGIAVMVGGLVFYYLLSRSAGRGSVLIAAVIMWGFGASQIDPSTRELLMLSGALKLTGSIGVILGIVDLVRNRPGSPQENRELEEQDKLA